MKKWGNRVDRVNHLLNKWAGACFSFAVFAAYILLSEGFDMYRFADVIGNRWLFMLFFIYGIICSLLVDLLVSRIGDNRKNRIRLALYVFFGMAVFFAVGGITIFSLFAGVIGAVFALLGFTGAFLASKSRGWKYGFSVAVPLLMAFILTTDFTIKREWTEQRTPDSFHAEFSYFNGEHKIMIKLEKGNHLDFSVYVQNGNGGGHGYHVEGAGKKYVSMEEIGENRLRIHADKDTDLAIIVTGDDLEGEVSVDWKIKRADETAAQETGK